MIQISGIKVKAPAEDAAPAALAAKRLGVQARDISRAVILRESVDAREKPAVYRVFTLGVESERGDGWLKAAAKRKHLAFADYKEDSFEIEALDMRPEGPRPVVAGFGPCGMFAALALAKMGLRPIVLERGSRMQQRVAAVEAFWAGGALDPECNVQFGEGGAGTFSDGKLTTGTKSPYAGWILRTFVRAGASESILYLAKPHIGTDVLRTAVVNIRKEIEALGGEVRFGCRLEGFETECGKLRAVKYSFADGSCRQTVTLPCSALVLAIGHSARDTYKNLLSQNILIEQKPFSIGLRIEHPQELIDLAQYGAKHADLGLGPADYKLNVKTSSGRGVYTFCMCPGGYVVNSSSEEGAIVTNGMSNASRDSGTANSALLADVLPEDFSEKYLPEGVSPSDPLAGAALQEKYERLAFALGGGKGLAPAQTVGSFLGTDPELTPHDASSKPSFLPGVRQADLSLCLPDFAADALKEALPLLGRKLKGFDSPKAVLTGIESRSSSPVRIKRDPEDLQGLVCSAEKARIKGFYPAGEGAGYAGGIMSAAADGVRIALKIAETLTESR